MSRHKTPLRYPGGKQKLAPFVAELIKESNLVGGHYAEPYAGGAGVAIDLLLSGTVSHIHLNDISKPVYAFWRAILTKPDDFCRLIAGASLTVEEWRRQKHILAHPSGFNQLEIGFSLFYLNRCNRSGILTAGVIGGNDQTGNWKIDARFPRNELIARIEAIARMRKSISVKNMDAEVFLTSYVKTLPKRTLVYCDPPYFNKADRLYQNHYAPEDHKRIARLIQEKLRHPWLVSYDGVPEIQRQYKKCRSFVYDLQYNASTAYQGREVFFFSEKVSIPSRSSVRCIDVVLSKAS